MANRQKRNKKPGKGVKIALRILIALLLALAALTGFAALNATVVRIRRAEVVLPDLPPAFDGATVLYASDIDLCGLNDAKKSGALFNELQSLNPDMLILGGDYSSPSLLEVLNRAENGKGDIAETLRQRESFFHYIGAFDAPMGVYAVAAPEDPDGDDLRRAMEANGIRPLFNERTAIRKGGDTLWLTGICVENLNLNNIAGQFSRGDCVIAVAYSPAALSGMMTSEAADGGRWADLTLCGHTHGGQIRLFGRSVLVLDSREQRLLHGWNTDAGLPLLVSQGIGCEGVNLRLGSEPEVWLITLRRQ